MQNVLKYVLECKITAFSRITLQNLRVLLDIFCLFLIHLMGICDAKFSNLESWQAKPENLHLESRFFTKPSIDYVYFYIWKLLEIARMAGYNGMAGNGLKWLDMAKNGWNGWQ